MFFNPMHLSFPGKQDCIWSCVYKYVCISIRVYVYACVYVYMHMCVYKLYICMCM